jgi:hypothetical protein
MNKVKYLGKDWFKNKNGNYESPTHRICTVCLNVFEKNKGDSLRICKPCNNKRVKEQAPEVKMFRRAKSRAKRDGREFNIELTDIIIPKVCPILEIPLVVHSGKAGGLPDSPTLDRILSTGGYTKGNIQVISQRANQMKNDSCPEEQIKYAHWILENIRI